jgi:hypothetical protein
MAKCDFLARSENHGTFYFTVLVKSATMLLHMQAGLRGRTEVSCQQLALPGPLWSQPPWQSLQ